MQYFLTVPHDSAEEPTMASMQELDPAEFEAMMEAVAAFNTALEEADVLRFAGGLHPPSTAKTVDVSADGTTVSDGPFVEAASYVGGFWVIDTEDEDEAVRWASMAATALGGRIEVRALQEAPGE